MMTVMIEQVRITGMIAVMCDLVVALDRTVASVVLGAAAMETQE